MTETIVLGGGCFWCTEGVFKALQGVHSVVPGYCGGHVEHPTYEQVCGKQTGHIEVVKVEFDPSVISYRDLLEVFFLTHDPTTPDRQGADQGPQYASAIFCQNDEQRRQAFEVIEEIKSQFDAPIVTHVLDSSTFWEAEAYHHDYFARNPEQAYCQMVIAPKLKKFYQRFQDLLVKS